MQWMLGISPSRSISLSCATSRRFFPNGASTVWCLSSLSMKVTRTLSSEVEALLLIKHLVGLPLKNPLDPPELEISADRNITGSSRRSMMWCYRMFRVSLYTTSDVPHPHSPSSAPLTALSPSPLKATLHTVPVCPTRTASAPTQVFDLVVFLIETFDPVAGYTFSHSE